MDFINPVALTRGRKGRKCVWIPGEYIGIESSSSGISQGQRGKCVRGSVGGRVENL